MALPIALVGCSGAPRRGRILYGLAACLLAAAAIVDLPQERAAGAALGRPRARLLPPAGAAQARPAGRCVALVGVHALPQRARLDREQMAPGQLGVATVGDRASDYDAVRPGHAGRQPRLRARLRDLRARLADSYRILDSDMLKRVVEMGLVGLVAFLFMVISVVVVAATIMRDAIPTARGWASGGGRGGLVPRRLGAVRPWSFPTRRISS